MNLPPLSFTVLDTETTGLLPKVNRIIEFASVRVEEGKVVSEYEQLISISSEVPPPVRILTRIRDEDLEGKPLMEDKREDILNQIGDGNIIVGQNVGFDIRMLKGEGIDLTDRPWIDTSMLASLVFPELESYSLGFVSQVLSLNHEPVHRALGDVHATLELLERCWERLLEVPAELREPMQSIMQRAPEAYQKLFSVIPASKTKAVPKWINFKNSQPVEQKSIKPLTVKAPGTGTVQLVEEPLSRTFLESLLKGAVDEKQRCIVAVKNLHSTLRMSALPDEVGVLHPPFALLDADSVATFAKQESYTADEATLALKLAWYEPEAYADFSIHGDEKSVWKGKLACAEKSSIYRQQFECDDGVFLIDHSQLLEVLANTDHPGNRLLAEGTHIIIANASMLEDTATKAYGWYCPLDDLRAAAEGDSALTKFVDTLQLWIERTRNYKDTFYLSNAELSSPDANGLRRQLTDLQSDEALMTKQPLAQHLESLAHTLNPDELKGRICWIEMRQNGSQFLQSVPERIGPFLKEHLYDRCSVTLLIPPHSAKTLEEILPKGTDTKIYELESVSEDFPISYEDAKSIPSIFENLPEGKTVILMSSRGKIENVFVNFTEKVEAAGGTLICQNWGGGMGRMQAEFIAAEPPAVWALTPWSFEVVELPAGSIDHLIIETLPFDHPKHTVLSKRAEHYQDSFNQYSLPRLKHRLHRLLRTFCQYRGIDGGVEFLDERLEKKAYGKEVWRELTVGDEKKKDEKDCKDCKDGKDYEDGKSSQSSQSSQSSKSSKKSNENQLTMF